MTLSHSVAFWFCIFALLAIQNTVTTKITREQRAHALRPRFVKRESQAPLIHAPAEKIDDEYIVKLKDGLTDEELAQFEEKFQALSEEHGEHVDFQLNMTSIMKGFVARIPGDAVDILRWLDEVEFVEEDLVAHVATSWGLDRIDQANLPLDNVYTSFPFAQGNGVNVYVIDSGIKYTHIEFGGRAEVFSDEFWPFRGEDCTGHGTHVAGIIGGNTVGVAPGVNLYSCRVFDCDSQGPTSGIIAAMDEIISTGETPAVVSMSLVSWDNYVINFAVRRLTEAGYIVVAAAGNNFFDACTLSPASAMEAITVGATDSTDGFSDFSNFGGCVNILAPGTDTYSANRWGGNDQYRTSSGTSYATPYVSGVVALLLEQDPSLTHDAVLKILMNAAASGKIDLSIVPETDQSRAQTPNQLLQIPINTGNSLKFFHEAKTFDDAQATCEAIGMILVKDSREEKHNAIIQDILNNEMGQTDIWINGRDYSGGSWYHTDGEYFSSYQPWAAGEPSGTFQCLQLRASSGHNWDDDSCSSTKPFICQKELPMVLFSVPETFDDAKSTCETSGLRLVKDISPGKHAAIIELLENNGMEQSSVWVNGKIDSSGTWVDTDGIPLGSYQPWAVGEPNGFNGYCVQLWAGSGHNWDDVSCTATKPYICEEEPPMKLFTDAVIFKVAYSICAAHSMSLVKDTSAEKHAAILALLQENGLESTSVWINGKIDSARVAIEYTDGLPLGSYQPWGPGQPELTNIYACLELWAEVGHDWAEESCLSERPFICQAER